MEAEKQAKKEKLEQEAEKVPFVHPKNGKFKCSNKGCNKLFLEEENTDTACNYHAGEPCFHDLKKFWTCCNVESWDWDDFMKLPTCKKGSHVKKMVVKK